MLIKEPTPRKEDVIILKDSNFNHKSICIVTGAEGGIGKATAFAAAVNGLNILGLDVNENGTANLVHAAGGKYTYLETDLTNDNEVKLAISTAADMGNIRYLANIAGIQHIDPIEDFPMEKFDYMQRLMVRAPFLLSKLCIPHMRKNKNGAGVIANMTSIHAHICTLNKVSYNMAKFALRGLTQSTAAEGAGKIRAFSVSTGFVKTALALKQIPAQAEQRGITEEQVITDVMLGNSKTKRMMDPIEVANIFMTGFHVEHFNGNDILCDGGVVPTY